MRWNLGSSGVLSLEGLTDPSGAFVNTATGALVIVDGDGVTAATLTADYVAASDGDYTFTIPPTIPLAEGVSYTGKLTMTADAGATVYYREISISPIIP